jgi:uncharacterized membrane protein YbaN (DUF454 family)
MDGRADTEAAYHASRIPRPVLLGAGWVCVVLGFIGVFIPGMPTTTFLLVAAWCFYRSSERAHTWLLENRLLGPYVRDFLSGKGMPLRSKVIAISAMWLACGTSAWFFVPVVWGKALVLGCAVIGTVVVVRVRPRAGVEAPETLPAKAMEPATTLEPAE